jgi:hypothetical protein
MVSWNHWILFCSCKLFQKGSHQNKLEEDTNQVKCYHDQKIIIKHVLASSHTGNIYPVRFNLYKIECKSKSSYHKSKYKYLNKRNFIKRLFLSPGGRMGQNNPTTASETFKKVSTGANCYGQMARTLD